MEKKVEVKTFKVSKICETCGKGEMLPDGNTILTTLKSRNNILKTECNDI